jgi:hypothetical protein
MRYITSAAPLPGIISSGGATNTSSPVTPIVVTSGSTPAPAPRTQETHRNLYPNGNEAEFKVYHDAMAGRKFKKVITDGAQKGHPIPKNARGQEMCITFHVLGNCTSFCSRCGDHNVVDGGANHTKAEDKALLKWCKACILPE